MLYKCCGLYETESFDFPNGTFNMIRLMASDLAKEDPLESGERGVIINTSSGAGHEGAVGQSAYVASKGGVIALTLALAREFGNLGIRVLDEA